MTIQAAARLREVMRRHRVALGAVLLCVLLGGYLLHPAFRAPNRIVGTAQDPLQTLWGFWWLRESLLSFSNPFFTHQLHHPHGISLVFQTFAFPDASLALLLSPFVGPVRAYDLVTFIEFVFTGAAAHFLLRQLGARPAAAALAACAACLMPYHVLQLQQHRNLASVGFVFLFLGLLARLIEQTPTRGLGALCGGSLALAALQAWHLLVVALLLAGGIVAPSLRRPRDLFSRPRLVALGVAGAVFALAAGPLMVATFLAREPTMVGRPAGAWAADLAGYFRLNACSAWLEVLHQSPVVSGTVFESGCYVGYVLLTLALAGAIRSARALAFLAVAIAGAWISLGPVPHLDGRPLEIPSLWDGAIRLVPALQFSAVPLRFGFVAGAGVLVAAALGLSALLARLELKMGRRALLATSVAPVALAVLELWPRPVVTADLPVAAPWATWARDPTPFSVLDFTGDEPPLWHAMHHRHPIIGGYVTRMPRKNELFLSNTPVVAAFATRTRVQPILRRVDPQIDFDFGSGGPDRVGSDYFHVEWTGALMVPNEGEYTLYLASDDGSELWLDGELAIDNRGIHPVEEKSTTRRLAAGTHALKIEYWELTGGAGVFLRWSGPDIPKQIVEKDALRSPDGEAGLLGSYGRLVEGWGTDREAGRQALRDLGVRYVVLPSGADSAAARDLALPIEYRDREVLVLRVP